VSTRAVKGARRRRGRARHTPILAVLDLGSNNCRLLVARPAGGGGFRVVDSFSRIVRLGEGVARTGRLSDAAIARTLAALAICAEHIRDSGATHVRAIVTAAGRGADNTEILVARALAETGIALEVVSAEEEAELAAAGCAPLIGRNFEGALVFDIGGGSTEIIWMRRDGRESREARIVHMASVPVGVVTLAEDIAHVAMDSASFDAMRARMIARLSHVREEMDALAPFGREAHHLLGTSGTVTTLAAVAMGMDRYVRSRVDASWHACTDILAVVGRLIGLDHAGRAAIGPIGPDRADLVLPGCAIFAAIHALWPCAQLRVADRGLREGMLRKLLKEAVS
jgi:exopolyphosphatase/guanosine-5'-triphosphate,3'-diphosphate pyrophosphatase